MNRPSIHATLRKRHNQRRRMAAIREFAIAALVLIPAIPVAIAFGLILSAAFAPNF